jgi:alkaline phosphatase D
MAVFHAVRSHASFILGCCLLSLSVQAADFEIVISDDEPTTRIAFGSCHKRKYVNVSSTIWEPIAAIKPHIFLWTGDAVYPPSRGVAPLHELETEYRQLGDNASLGYSGFKPPQGIFGVLDDHDYGANDGGKELTQKEERRRLFQDFLQYPTELKNKIESRQGLYHSIDLVHRQLHAVDKQQRVKIVMLDTRWFRDAHCIPSVAASSVPLGAAIACVTRWIVAGLGWTQCSKSSTILGEEQWAWFTREVQESGANFTIVVSSIQVLSTNPAMEGWSHFPAEQERLLRLLNKHSSSGMIVLSGDVHHAEISSLTASIKTKKESWLEVTSSGLTHTCKTATYGAVCEPILMRFDKHRRNPHDYYLDLNFGALEVNWAQERVQADIYNKDGDIVLTTGWRSWARMDHLTESELTEVAKAVDGHLLPLIHLVGLVLLVLTLGILLQFVIWTVYANPSTRKLSHKEKED